VNSAEPCTMTPISTAQDCYYIYYYIKAWFGPHNRRPRADVSDVGARPGSPP